jgi:hypothetical protein
VLVGKMQKPTLKALDYAIAARHESIEAIHVNIDDEASAALSKQWDEMNITVPLRIVPSPYRDISVPLIKYIKARRAEYGSEVVTVYTPMYIVGHWWENLLHNHKSRRIRQKLMLVHGVTVAIVPWLLDSSKNLYGRQRRPLPGQDRRGEPRRPVMRGPLPPAKGFGPKSGAPTMHSSESEVDRTARLATATATATKAGPAKTATASKPSAQKSTTSKSTTPKSASAKTATPKPSGATAATTAAQDTGKSTPPKQSAPK